MKYIANHFMTVNGKFVTRGEIFEADYSPEQEERLKRLGAIREADAPAPAPDEAQEADGEGREEAAGEPEDLDEAEENQEADNQDMPEEKLTIDPMDAVTPRQEEKKRGTRGKEKNTK